MFYLYLHTESPIVRRLMFVSRYNVSCMLVENAYNRETLVPSISQQKGNLQTICAPGNFIVIILLFVNKQK